MFSSEVVQVLLPFKKREDFLICSFISIYLLYEFYLMIGCNKKVYRYVIRYKSDYFPK